MDYPEEERHKPGPFAVRAYDATWAISLALNESQVGGQSLLEKVSQIDFNGLTGKVKFIDRKIANQNRVFQIVNVIGKSYRELGLWSNELGFSKTINQKHIHNYSSMKSLGQVFWPGGHIHTPRGWSVSEIAKPMRIGVPTATGSSIEQFVKLVVDKETNITSYTGFSIDIFNATVQGLPYQLSYEFYPFIGTYDELVHQVYLKNFDAVVGDVSIVARRCQHAEFTLPYTEPGLVMIVPVQSKLSNKAWLFMKPFTKVMWVLIPVINIYNGFVVWLIERNHCPELKGSPMNQIGTLLWLGFTTLFSLHGQKLHSNLSRMAMVVWLFVALVITQSYTASLTSMLTVQQLEPTIADIETIKSSNAMVGCSTASFVSRYLVDVLQFKHENIKQYYTAPEHYAQALRSKEIMAAFLEVPLAKLFLAKYCKSFIIAGPTYKIGGFAFVFPKGSPMLADVNEALLNLTEKGKFRELENIMTASEKCVDVEVDYENAASLSLGSFSVLFVLTGGTSTVALAIYIFLGKWKINKSELLQHKNIWTLILAVIKNWGQLKRRFSRRVSDTTDKGSTRNYPDASDSWTQV